MTSLLGLSFIVHKSEFELWSYFYSITMGIGLITMHLSDLINKKQKKLLIIFKIMTLILLFGGCVFSL